MISYLVFYKILQFFIIMALGFILVKSKVIKADESIVLSKISLFLLMPAAIITAFNIDSAKSEIISGLILAFAIAFIIHIVFLIIDMCYKKFIHAGTIERASVFYSNAGNMIIPIVGFALGEKWVVYTSAYLSVQLIFIWTHGVKLFNPDLKLSIKKILGNVNMIAIAIGVVILISGLKVPAIATDILSTLGGMLGYVGMLITGMLAAKVDYKRVFQNKRLYFTVLMRMIVVSSIVLVTLKVLLKFISIKDADKILLIPFLASITPSAATIVQFSQIYGDDTQFAVAVNVVTTIVCVITIPMFVILYQL